MKNNKINESKLKELKAQFENIEIPQELEGLVQKAIAVGLEGNKVDNKVLEIKEASDRRLNMKRYIRKSGIIAAAVIIGFIGAVNLSPSFAQSMNNVPVIKDLVKVFTFNQYTYKKDTYEANIKAPVITGLKNETLQNTLNNKYLEENKKLFKQFESEVGSIDKIGKGAHLGVDSGFEIKTNNDEILSIGRYVVNTAGSSSTTMTYDTIDKKNEIVITLPSLFKNDSYIDIISKNIKDQIKDRVKKDPNQIYWVKGEENAIGGDGFDKIKPDQQFYINEQGKLVISFDKYEIAPGCMGLPEFEIPTKVIQDILVSNAYIK